MTLALRASLDAIQSLHHIRHLVHQRHHVLHQQPCLASRVFDEHLDASDLVTEIRLGGISIEVGLRRQGWQNLLDAGHPSIEAFEYGFHLGNQHRPTRAPFRARRPTAGS
jgi:hypothetical protein